ncbi:hypothetical protein ACNKHV_21440 [Shigella flexneri]
MMSMLRLWWIPYGETADQARMFTIRWMIPLSILALKSKRHRCTAIGGASRHPTCRDCR